MPDKTHPGKLPRILADGMRDVRAGEGSSSIPTELLADFMSHFLGYGNPGAELWFFGMEEGGGAGLDELSRRLTAWDAAGRRSFEELPAYHHCIGLAKNFLPPFPLQRTWAPLIRCLLAFRGEAEPMPARIREVQANGLGTQHGDTVLAELLPMPSPGVAHWPYAGLAELIPYLKDRKTYADALRQPRVELLRAAIHVGKPKAVVFYGLGYIDAWNAIAGVTLPPMVVAGRSIFAATRDSVKYYAVPHPVAHGMTHAFWTELGGIMR